MRTLPLFFLLCFLVAIDQITTSLVRIDVKRGRRIPSKTTGFVRKSLVETRYGLNRKLNVKLTNVENIYYYGAISIGTPPKTFLMNFDTGSGDTWVYSSRCTLAACKKRSKYNSAASRTWSKHNQPFWIVYGDGSFVEGSTVFDTFRIGNIEIRRQGFAQINYAFAMDDDKNDGIMGLGFKALANTKFATPIDNAFSQKKLSNKIISFWLNQNLSSAEGGSLTIGGIDKTRYTGIFFFS